jgi:hypothetical protein
MPTTINLPGGAVGTRGPALGVTTGSFYTDQYNVVFPNAAAGVRRNLDGNYIVKIHAISPDRFTPSGSPDNAIWYGPAGANYRPGETITSATDPSTLVQLRIFYNGTQPSWYRNDDGLGRCTDNNISTGEVVYTYPGSIAGTWSWYTVPSTPASINVSATGTTATITRGVSTSDASYPVTSYTLQRRQSSTTIFSGAWTTVSTNMGTSYTNSGLTPSQYYQFRVYANNNAGTSQAVVSSTIFVAALTIYKGTAFAVPTNLKKHNGTSWVSLATGLYRYNGTTWIKIDTTGIT